jgi:hypothetical protein
MYYFDLPMGLAGVTPEDEDYLHETLMSISEAVTSGALVDPFPLHNLVVSPFLSTMCIASELMPSDGNSAVTPQEIETICRSRKDLFTVITEGEFTYVVARAKKVGGTLGSAGRSSAFSRGVPPVSGYGTQPRFRYDRRLPFVGITKGKFVVCSPVSSCVGLR